MAQSTSRRRLRAMCMQTYSCNLLCYSKRMKGIAYSNKTVRGCTRRRNRWQCCANSSVAGSFDLSPLDYFLWGYLKDKIFEAAVLNENVLCQKIVEEIQRILPHTLRMVFKNLRRWAFMCKNVLGTQFQHLL